MSSFGYIPPRKQKDKKILAEQAEARIETELQSIPFIFKAAWYIFNNPTKKREVECLTLSIKLIRNGQLFVNRNETIKGHLEINMK